MCRLVDGRPSRHRHHQAFIGNLRTTKSHRHDESSLSLMRSLSTILCIQRGPEDLAVSDDTAVHRRAKPRDPRRHPCAAKRLRSSRRPPRRQYEPQERRGRLIKQSTQSVPLACYFGENGALAIGDPRSFTACRRTRHRQSQSMRSTLQNPL